MFKVIIEKVDIDIDIDSLVGFPSRKLPNNRVSIEVDSFDDFEEIYRIWTHFTLLNYNKIVRCTYSLQRIFTIEFCS